MTTNVRGHRGRLVFAFLAAGFAYVATTGGSARAAQLGGPSATAPSTFPSSAPAAGGTPLTATVTGVEGLVQVRLSEAEQWIPCKVGQQLGEGAEFRTGPRSAVRFVIPPDQTITLDRLGTVKLLQAVQDRSKVITDLGMKYGRTRYDIEAPGVEHQSTVRSPNSTLAVRGTKVSLFDQRPFAAEAASLVGRAELQTKLRNRAFGASTATGTSRVVGESAPAQVALEEAVVDPSIPAARTGDEAELVQSVLSQGAVLDISTRRALPIVRGGIPPTDDQLVLPGNLNFVLRWNSDANLDLSVVNQAGKGEILVPIAELSTTRSGGRIPFDHRGGANGGIEVAFFTGSPPPGAYGVFIDFVSGSPSDFTLDVFKDGERTLIRDQGGNGGAGADLTTLRGRSEPGVQTGGTVPVGITLPPIITDPVISDPGDVQVTANAKRATNKAAQRRKNRR